MNILIKYWYWKW